MEKPNVMFAGHPSIAQWMFFGHSVSGPQLKGERGTDGHELYKSGHEWMASIHG